MPLVTGKLGLGGRGELARGVATATYAVHLRVPVGASPDIFLGCLPGGLIGEVPDATPALSR